MKKFLFVFILTFFVYCNGFSQINTSFPSYGETDVSTKPTITIELDSIYKFDFSSLDTLGVILDSLVYYDSTNNRYSMAATYLFNQDYYSSTDSSLGVAVRLGSRIYVDSILSENKIQFTTTYELPNSVEYGIMFEDLRVVNTSTNDTIVIDTIVNNYFTTIREVDAILYSNVTNSEGLKCSDSIVIKFNNPMPYFKNINNEPIVELRKILNSSSYQGTSNDTLLTLNHEFNIDSTELKVWLDDGFEPFVDYQCAIKLSAITNDTTKDFHRDFIINSNTFLNFQSQTHNPSNFFSLPSAAKAYLEGESFRLNTNDSIYIETPFIVDGYIFQKWITPENLTFSNDSSYKTYLKAGCDVSRYSVISPLYRKIPVDTLEIQNPIHPTFLTPMSTVSVSGYKDSLGNDKYTFYRNTSSGLLLSATPIYNVVFKEWDSDAEDDGNEENNIVTLKGGNNNNFATNKKVIYKPVWQPPSVLCTDVSVCAVVRMKDSDYDIYDIENDIDISINYSSTSDNLTFNSTSLNEGEACKSFSTPFPSPFEVSFDIDVPECFEIVRYYLKKGNLKVGTWDDYQTLGKFVTTNTFVVNKYAEDCKVELIVEVRRKLNYVIAEGRMKDLTKFPFLSRYADIRLWDPNGSLADTPYWLQDGTRNPKLEYNTEGEVIKATSIHAVKCGVEYRAVPYTKNSTGYENYQWICPNPYEPETLNLTCLNVVNDQDYGENVLKFTANDKYTYIRHDFQSGFRIEKIGYLRLDGSGAYDMFDVDRNLPNDDLALLEMSVTGLSRGSSDPMGSTYNYSSTRMKLVFNKTLDESSLYNNIIIEDIPSIGNFRYDGNEKREYTFRNSSNNGNDQIGGFNSNEVIITLISNDQDKIEVPHMTSITLKLNDNIKSSDNEPLINHQVKFRRRTEYPSYEIVVTKMENYIIKYIYDYLGINYSQDNFVHTYSNYSIVQDPSIALGPLLEEFKLQVPSLNEYKTLYGDNASYTIGGQGLILNTIPRLTPRTYVGMGSHALVDNYGSVISKLYEIATAVTAAIEVISPGAWELGSKLLEKSEDDKKSGWFFLRDDETVGITNYRFSEQDHLWGCGLLYRYQEYGQFDQNLVRVYFKTVLK